MTTKPIEYEKLVKAVYAALLQQDSVENIEVLHNTRLVGKSGATHQIDVMWKFAQAGVTHTVLVECKDCGRPREKSEIAEFKAILDDLHGRPRGIFVRRSGFQDGALKFASHHDIELIVLRAPRDEDWSNDELRGFNVKFCFQQRLYDVHGIAVDENLAREILVREHRLTKGTPVSIVFPTRIGRDISLFDGSGNRVGSLVKSLDEISDLSEGDLGSREFTPSVFIETGHALLPLCPIKAVTFSYKAHSFGSETQIDFMDLIKVVLKNVQSGTQIRFDHNLKPQK